MLTCYDASFARLLDDAGVDVLLIGDSLGMTLQGATRCPSPSTRWPTTCGAWRAATASPGSSATCPSPATTRHRKQALLSAAALMRAGAHMVKLEGGGWTVPVVRHLVERGIPVCAHLGLTPQSVHALGGYRIQGRDEDGAERLLREAHEAEAGAAMLVVELIPSALGERLAQNLPIPVIGIGAGPGCTGRVLVLHDMLGVTRGGLPRFVRNFMRAATASKPRSRAYVAAVQGRQLPDPPSMATEAPRPKACRSSQHRPAARRARRPGQHRLQCPPWAACTRPSR